MNGTEGSMRRFVLRRTDWWMWRWASIMPSFLTSTGLRHRPLRRIHS